MMMVAIVMAGGRGTRLWPASRNKRPKQFIPLLGRECLLSQTISRLCALVPLERIWIVANADHRDLVTATVPAECRIICEPSGRGTAPCLGLAALYLQREFPAEVAVALPADNWIAPEAGFIESLRAAARLAADGGLAIVGTTPSSPATGFGYILPGSQVSESGFALAEFREKPHRELAVELCRQGWLWNAGVFAFRAAELRREITNLQPGLARTLELVEACLGTPAYEERLAQAWRELPAISMDEGLMMRAPRPAWVVRGEYDWSDLGTWDAVRRAVLHSRQRNAVEGDGLVCGGQDCYVSAQGGRFVALVGAQGLTVIDTPDALLILGPGQGQEVRTVPAYLQAVGREELC